MIKSNLEICRYNPERHDSLLETLTEILHRSYSVLAKQGMQYLASHQSPTKTRERLLRGKSYLFFFETELIGTVTLYPPRPLSSCEYYRKNGVFSFGQFAVTPELQGKGLGSQIMKFLESRAKQLGARELALDTAEGATHLIGMYSKRGYKIVSTISWDETNYQSVIMSKELSLDFNHN